MNQGEPLSATIFNMVLDALVRHSILLVAGDVGRKGVWRREVLRCAAFFCIDYGPVVLTDPVWLQGTFDAHTRVFRQGGA